jgi:iron complex outermembrane receptor protein
MKMTSSLYGTALAAVLTTPAFAQSTEATSRPSAQAAQSSSVPGDIVVTARRRAENLQDVPVAITALTGATLQERNITDVSALDGIAPNVKVVESNSNTTTYIQIRGSVTTNPNPGYEPAAAMYVDGVYIGKAVGSTIDIADIDHIEVLRGPQGTLFGRNTLSGAINIITRKPSGEFGGMLKVGIGNYGRHVAQGSVDLPAFGDFSVKLAGLWSERNGYLKTRADPFGIVPGSTPTVKRLGDEKSRAMRAAIRYAPSKDVVFDYTVDFNRMRNTPGQGTLQGVGAGGIFDPASPVYSGVPLSLYVQTGKRPHENYATAAVDGAKLFEGVKSWTHTFTGTFEVGATTIKSITAYRDLEWQQSLDLDASPLPLAAAGSDLDYWQFSQELQASGKVGRVNYTGGLYYFRDHGGSANPQQFFGTTLVNDAVFKTRAYAVYAQVDWNPPILNDKLTLTAGYRYSDERKTVRRFASAGGFVTIPADTRAAKTFTGSTPTFIAKYDITDDFNVYAKYSQGFKSGGFSTDASTPATAITPYDPEIVKSVEIGSKLRLFDGRLRINAAAFFDKHNDQQIAVFTPTSAGFVTLTTNDARSKIKGFELEVQATPTNGLLLSANVGRTDAKFTEFFAFVGGPNVAATQAFAFVPRWVASGTADVTVVDRESLKVNVALDVLHNGKNATLSYSTDPAVNPNIYATLADAQTVLDGRLTFSRIPVGSSELQLTGFVKNIFNDASVTAGIDFGASFGNIVTRNYNWPRTFGADLTLRF